MEPIKRLSETLTLTAFENQYGGECWRCSRLVGARAGTLYREQDKFILLCSRCARIAAGIRARNTARRVNTRVHVPKRG
jgi:hypothetical protein